MTIIRGDFLSRVKYIPMNTNHPRTLRQAQGKFLTTNTRMPAHIRIFVTPFVDGMYSTKGKHPCPMTNPLSGCNNG